MSHANVIFDKMTENQLLTLITNMKGLYEKGKLRKFKLKRLEL